MPIVSMVQLYKLLVQKVIWMYWRSSWDTLLIWKGLDSSELPRQSVHCAPSAEK